MPKSDLSEQVRKEKPADVRTQFQKEGLQRNPAGFLCIHAGEECDSKTPKLFFLGGRQQIDECCLYTEFLVKGTLCLPDANLRQVSEFICTRSLPHLVGRADVYLQRMRSGTEVL